MQTWYECKVKYLKIDQGGYERKVNDNYLLDAISFTDAEARIFQKMQEITSAEFQVMNIKKSNITEVIPGETGEWWYKAKISLVTVDEEAGKEKKVNQYILIMADDINQALKRLEDGMAYMLVPYVATSMQLSTIVEVFPYDNDEELQDKIVERKPLVAESDTDEISESDESEELEDIDSYEEDDDSTLSE